MSLIRVFIIALELSYTQVLSSSVSEHLEMGKKLLMAGQLGEALSQYHAAVDGDPSNYLTFFKRATVFLALGRHQHALSDFETVIKLKPDFTHAKLERAAVLLKQGNIGTAEKVYTSLLKSDPAKAEEGLREIPPLREAVEEADNYMENSDWANALDALNKAIETAKWDTSLREKRADCFLKLGNAANAISDIRAVAKLTNDNTAAYLRLAQLHYVMGEEDESLKEIRECLKLDQDHKECHKHYKVVKKLVKQMTSAQDKINESDYIGAITNLEKALKIETSEKKIVVKIYSRLCLSTKQANQPKEAIMMCSKVLQFEESDIEALVNRAEAYILDDELELAVKDYQTAAGISDSKHIKEGLKKAERMLKQSKKRDYYKILGVSRSAGKKEINKAYRKLAMEFHPDKFTDEEEKKEAEKKFIDIAAAKEVLSDAEKREQFDNGEDPLDPESEQGKNFHHQHFQGNPFGGGQQFFFKFG